MNSLPKILEINVNDYPNEVEKVYAVYLDQIFKPRLNFMGVPIVCRQDPLDQGKHECFWHLITESHKGERIPDFRRMERIKFCPYIIRNYDNTDIVCWQKQHTKRKGTENRVYLWLKKHDYVVILGEQRRKGQINRYHLVTAYVTNREHTKQKFLREEKIYRDPRQSGDRP